MKKIKNAIIVFWNRTVCLIKHVVILVNNIYRKADEKTAESRLNIQNDDTFYTQKADFVITNSKDCDLKAEIEKVLKEI